MRRVVLVVFMLIMMACASVSLPSNFTCMPLNCALVLVDNETKYNTKAISVNGNPISSNLPMETSGRFFMPRSDLREGGMCAVISVKLENEQQWVSGTECANVDEYFFLVIASPISASSFTPLQAGQGLYER